MFATLATVRLYLEGRVDRLCLDDERAREPERRFTMLDPHTPLSTAVISPCSELADRSSVHSPEKSGRC